ncbi:MAG: hypothetical protein JXR70_09020 [Spirochaetales bacterium]|nr:hypothetical protein [Spirochaetales bacterium]
MKKKIFLPILTAILATNFSCELANVYRPTEVESANILESVQKIFLPVAYEQKIFGSKYTVIENIDTTSNNGLKISGTYKGGTEPAKDDEYVAILDITVTADKLEIKENDITFIDGSLDFYTTLVTEKITIKYQGELSATYKNKEIRIALNITAEINKKDNTMKASGTYNINSVEYNYAYDGDGPLKD